MKKLCCGAAFALVFGVALSAQSVAPGPAAPQTGPDLSGRWTRDGQSTAAGSTGWGPQVDINQRGVLVTIGPPSRKPQQFMLNGRETGEVLSVEGCKNTIRVTKSVPERDRVTITTWLITKSGCAHSETDSDPLITHTGEIAENQIRGPRKLESITVVSRDGGTLTVDTTRSVPGDAPVSTTTTYRK